MDNLIIIVLVITGLILLFLAFNLGRVFGKKIMFEYMREYIKKEREDAAKRSRSSLVGNFSEQISPYLPEFPLKPSEVKFLGKPVDFIGFKGLDEENVKEIVFIEVKSGNSQLTKCEKSIKNAVENNKIRFEKYRIDKEITHK